MLCEAIETRERKKKTRWEKRSEKKKSFHPGLVYVRWWSTSGWPRSSGPSRFSFADLPPATFPFLFDRRVWYRKHTPTAATAAIWTKTFSLLNTHLSTPFSSSVLRVRAKLVMSCLSLSFISAFLFKNRIEKMSYSYYYYLPSSIRFSLCIGLSKYGRLQLKEKAAANRPID